MRKMIPAVIMLLISAMLVGTSTYAWFSMNRTVTVTGMKVTAKGTDNVMIANADTVETYIGDSNPSTDPESLYAYSIDQTRTGNLKPASTINGTNYFYTRPANVTATGDTFAENEFIAYNENTAWSPDPDTGANKTNYDNGFNTNYGVTSVNTSTVVYGYIDYNFYIKATNAKEGVDAEARQQALNLSYCNLRYNYAAIPASVKAFRVAVLASAATTKDTVAGALSLKTILAPADYAYFTTGQAVGATNELQNLAVTVNTAAKIADVASGTHYYKVVVRLWLEGEDTTCTNETFANLTSDWTLDLAFSMGEGSAVTALGSAASALAEVDSTYSYQGNATFSLINEEALSHQWKDASNDNNATGTGNNTEHYQAASAGNYYCLITTKKGSVYRTNTISLTAAPANP